LGFRRRYKGEGYGNLDLVKDINENCYRNLNLGEDIKEKVIGTWIKEKI